MANIDSNFSEGESIDKSHVCHCEATVVEQASNRMKLEHPAIYAEVQRRVEALNSTKNQQSFSIRQTFKAWEEQSNRVYALVAAVRNSLVEGDSHFNEVQLLDIAQEILGDLEEVNHLKNVLGVEV